MSEPQVNVTLSANRYGKDKVRVLRVIRPSTPGGKQIVLEYTVRLMIEGDFATSYTQADNSMVVPTDTMKNTVYVFAKTSPHVATPELFGLHLASHMVTKYPHVTKAFVDIDSLKWSRIPVQGVEHKHSFVRDGEERRTTSVEVDGTQGKDKLVGKVTSGIQDLLVLKSSGSAFENFHQDEYTTLIPVSDRIFSTSVDLNYTFELPALAFGSVDKLEAVDIEAQFNRVAASAKETTLEVFAVDESASATLYKMATDIIRKNPSVGTVSYKLPNKHYIPVDLSYMKLDNLKPADAEVFCPVAAPSGYITATVSRA
ncbi:probable urate oxidase (uricase) [Serendipita indica DSM 11827]|uniref:Uricase n=1 Tax=Serendipita indica (strain DSM 11827) TaxID=1109443 RepID=G4T710_SERID|nr:probable urate oxidase (uricase) [Serendipita indica DSM 11827]